jgi:CheY-like chemotaxis protein
VEDDPAIQDVVRASLSEPIDLVAVGTLKEAVERIKASRFDLVILDLLLPDGSGLDLLPALRSSAKPSTPVLVFSAEGISPLAARHVSAVLETSTTSNEKLASSIQGFLGAYQIPQVKGDVGPGAKGSTGPRGQPGGELLAAAKVRN